MHLEKESSEVCHGPKPTRNERGRARTEAAIKEIQGHKMFHASDSQQSTEVKAAVKAMLQAMH